MRGLKNIALVVTSLVSSEMLMANKFQHQIQKRVANLISSEKVLEKFINDNHSPGVPNKDGSAPSVPSVPAAPVFALARREETEEERKRNEAARNRKKYGSTTDINSNNSKRNASVSIKSFYSRRK